MGPKFIQNSAGEESSILITEIRSETDEKRQAVQTMNILLAEDERNFGRVFKHELEDEGYTVDLVGNGVEAVLKFMEGDYGFVLFDIQMPVLDGINALKIVKKVAPGVPAIIFSGDAGTRQISESLKAGAIRYFTKPFEFSEVKKEIRKYFSVPINALQRHRRDLSILPD